MKRTKIDFFEILEFIFYELIVFQDEDALDVLPSDSEKMAKNDDEKDIFGVQPPEKVGHEEPFSFSILFYKL